MLIYSTDTRTLLYKFKIVLLELTDITYIRPLRNMAMYYDEETAQFRKKFMVHGYVSQ